MEPRPKQTGVQYATEAFKQLALAIEKLKKNTPLPQPKSKYHK